LHDHKGFVKMKCQKQYGDKGILRDIPLNWLDENGELNFDLNEPSDYTFRPLSSDFKGEATLQTGSYEIRIDYQTLNDENAFQIYHPEGASFVCIEPVTAKNPREMKQRKNSLLARIRCISI
jgi:galactose mutarotase-like enzyme